MSRKDNVGDHESCNKGGDQKKGNLKNIQVALIFSITVEGQDALKSSLLLTSFSSSISEFQENSQLYTSLKYKKNF